MMDLTFEILRRREEGITGRGREGSVFTRIDRLPGFFACVHWYIEK